MEPERDNLGFGLNLVLKDTVRNNLRELAENTSYTKRDFPNLAAYVAKPFRTYAAIQHNGTMEHIAQQLTHKGWVAIYKSSKDKVMTERYIGELTGKHGLHYIPQASFIVNEFESGYVISLDDRGWEIMRTAILNLPRYFMDYDRFLADELER